MRSKAVICGLVTALLFTSCKTHENTKHLGGGSVIDEHLLVALSLPAIEAKLHFVEKREVAAGDSRFVFYIRFPYRGVPDPQAIYCYEQIRPDVWFLRGFFPITMWNFQDLTSKTEVDFLADGNSVNVVGNGTVLFSIRSMASAIRKNE
jgi:hypothetical protein